MKQVSKLDPATLEVFDARIFAIAAKHGKNLGLLEPIPESGYYVLVSFNDNFLTANKKLRQALGIGANAATITAENDINSDDFKDIYTLVDCYLNDENSMERPSLVDEFYMDIMMATILIIIIPFIIVFDIISLPLEITYLIIKHHKKVKKQKEINEWKGLNGLK